MPFRLIATELLWFLRGDTNIKFLVENDCHIWNGDAWKNYQHKASKEDFLKDGVLRYEEFVNKIKTDDEFAKKWGDLGPIYGKQWRGWSYWSGLKLGDRVLNNKKSIDQIQNLINDLKPNPDSRRLMVNAWNVGELDSMVLPPCHYGFQVYTRELSFEERCDIFKPNTPNFRTETNTSLKDLNIKIMNDCEIPTRAISLMFNMRSNDVPLGLPFNIASYALLLEIIGKMVNMIPDELIINLGDAHIYKNQVDGVKEQLTREPFELPKLVISNQINFNGSVNEFLNSCLITDFIIENYQSHPTIKMPLSN
jgi:thymidylate synthase